MRPKIAVLQPEVPHYREEFFQRLAQHCERADVYVYHSQMHTRKHGFNTSNNNERHLRNLDFHDVLLYNPFPLCTKRYDTLVLMLHFAHLTTWLLLLTKWLHRKRIVLWGQGISVKRYLTETKEPDWRLKWMIALADGVWIYEEPEAKQWQSLFPRKPIVALNNTLTDAEKLCREVVSTEEKTLMKKKWDITEETVFIFCARFDNNYRRPDLLLETIRQLNGERFGFIIIGDGRNKPDFSSFHNVHDFGAVYDKQTKHELFATADAYFQPGWVGLSIVEAMAQGKPVLTFRRSAEILQCVEYCYIQENVNGIIFNDIEDCLRQINALTKEQLTQMGAQARNFVVGKLTPRQMTEAAMTVLNEFAR